MKHCILINYLKEYLQKFMLKNSRTSVFWKTSYLVRNPLHKNSPRFGLVTSLQITIYLCTVPNGQILAAEFSKDFCIHSTSSVLPWLLHVTLIMTTPFLEWLYHYCKDYKCVLVLLVLRLFLKPLSRVFENEVLSNSGIMNKYTFLPCWHEFSLLTCLVFPICWESSKKKIFKCWFPFYVLT